MNHDVEPTIGIGLKLWWAFTWRGAFFGVLGAIAIGVVLGIVGALIKLDPVIVAMASGIIGLVYGIYMMAWAVRRVMIKGFGRYRLTVVEQDA